MLHGQVSRVRTPIERENERETRVRKREERKRRQAVLERHGGGEEKFIAGNLPQVLFFLR